MVGEALLACPLEAPPAGLSDGVSASVVLIVRRHVADAGVEADRVVLVAHPVELVLQERRVNRPGISRRLHTLEARMESWTSHERAGIRSGTRLS